MNGSYPLQNNVVDDDEPSYWPPGVPLPLISNSTLLPHQLLPHNAMLLLYEFFMMIVMKMKKRVTFMKNQVVEILTWKKLCRKAILSSQKGMKDKMQNLSWRMNSLEEMIAVSSSSTTSGSDDATLKRQRISI